MSKYKIILVVILVVFLFSGIFIYKYEIHGFEQLESLDCLDSAILNRGENEVKKHKIIISGIARDNAKDLPNSIRYIEHTGNFFEDYRVIIFENDSSDGSKEILLNWSLKNNKVKIISKDFGNKKRPNIQFLADARNFYLEEVTNNNTYEDFDMLMVVDMDMRYGWDMRGIFHSFGLINEWDAICSNGVKGDEAVMYDAFAFRSKEFPHNLEQPNYWTEIVPQIQKVYEAGGKFVPVYSCFGGMAFYKTKFVNNCKYSSTNDDCEHVAFHMCINENQGKMFMNPSQMIRYKGFRSKFLTSLSRTIFQAECLVKNFFGIKSDKCETVL